MMRLAELEEQNNLSENKVGNGTKKRFPRDASFCHLKKNIYKWTCNQ